MDAALTGMREAGPLAGPIRVTATNDFGREQLRPLLDAFQLLHPGIHISLMLNDSTVQLIDEHIDLAVRNGPLADSSLHARLLVRGERLVCAAPDYWRRHGKPAVPGDLAGHNCLILARPGAPLAAWPFRVNNKALSVKVSGDRDASDGGVLRQWALAGKGVIIKNRWDIRAELAAGTLETVLDEYVAEQIDLYAVYPAAAPSRRVAALIDFLAAQLAE
jgi:DNA-binding transcriptional LysR family regulator